MKYLERRIKETYRKLIGLGISRDFRKDLIKDVYSVKGYLIFYPIFLKFAIKEVYEKNLTGEMAEKYIVDYFDKLTMTISNEFGKEDYLL